MKKLTFDYTHTANFIAEHEVDIMSKQVMDAAKLLESKKGPGHEFTGWMDLPKNYDKKEFARIKKAAKRIQKSSEVFVVIGIGGSYLGAKSAIEFLNNSFYNNLPATTRKTPEIYFAGTNISGTYLTHLQQLIGDRDFSVNMISKSGTTTEPAIAFRFFKALLEKKYGKKGAKDRIFATTDKERGALRQLASQEGYETFVVPDDVGGRFSVLTAVGLLPIAVSGADISELMNGAKAARKDFKDPFEKNACYQYVAIRNILYNKGVAIEMLINYEPRLHYIAEWWKQLYGESEGKDQKGLFTASADFTADLHSLGQYIQDGRRILMETLLEIGQPETDLTIQKNKANLDGLNYLAGKDMDYVNKKAAEGTILAHVAGGVPNLKVTIPEATAFHLGYLFYFFEKACAVSGYVLGVNPFNQPGVEAYKRKMFELLGKPGY